MVKKVTISHHRGKPPLEYGGGLEVEYLSSIRIVNSAVFHELTDFSSVMFERSPRVISSLWSGTAFAALVVTTLLFSKRARWCRYRTRKMVPIRFDMTSPPHAMQVVKCNATSYRTVTPSDTVTRGRFVISFLVFFGSRSSQRSHRIGTVMTTRPFRRAAKMYRYQR